MAGKKGCSAFRMLARSRPAHLARISSTLFSIQKKAWHKFYLQVALVLVILGTSNYIHGCVGIQTSHEVVKSPVYPHFPAGTKSFADSPVHGAVVAVQVWYSDSRIFGLQSTFLDKYRGSIHGYPVGNTSIVTVDPSKNQFLVLTGDGFGNTGEDGSVGAVGTGYFIGDQTGGPKSLPGLPNTAGSPGRGPAFGDLTDVSSAGYGTEAAIIGLTGSVDHTGITQVGTIIDKRRLSFKQFPSGYTPGRLHWPKETVVRSKASPRLPAVLVPFDDGDTGKHGEVVTVQVWSSVEEGVLGIRATFRDGYTSPVRGSSEGPSDTLSFDPKTNPLVAVGGRGGPVMDPDNPTDTVYRLRGLAFFAGTSSPPVRSRVYGSPEILTYSDSADGKVVGFFGQVGHDSRLVQLGVYVVSPVNGLVVSSGPYPRVSPAAAVPFDHTGDNVGVSKVEVYYDNFIGVRGLRFTYVTKLGFEYATPVYGQSVGLHKQMQFDCVNNPLVNLNIQVANVLAGKGEVGVVGLSFYTLRKDYIGMFGVQEFGSNVTDGSRRVVGFHGQADTVVNSLGVYTAPL